MNTTTEKILTNNEFVCVRCAGEGYRAGVVCHECKGNGYLIHTHHGNMLCPVCGGTPIKRRYCNNCKGEGIVEVTTAQVPDPKGAAGKTKRQLHLVPPVAIEHCAQALEQGIHPSKNYGPFNWRENKVCVTTYISAMMRHLDAFRDGEDTDPGSPTGSSHLGAIMANCAILLDAAKSGNLVDDRTWIKKHVAESPEKA